MMYQLTDYLMIKIRTAKGSAWTNREYHYKTTPDAAFGANQKHLLRVMASHYDVNSAKIFPANIYDFQLIND